MGEHIPLQRNSAKACRICFDTDNPNDLISPCLCKGGSAYVHRKCLDDWRSVNKNGRAFKFCDVCQFEYVIEPVVDNPSSDKHRLLVFRLLVTRDMTLIVLLFQLIIVAMTFLLQAADKKSNTIKDLYPNSMSSFGIYYLSSLILFFAFLGFLGLIGFCCGWMNDNHNTNRSNDTCPNCACYPYNCICLDCHGCDGPNNCGGDGGNGGGAAVVVIVIILIFAAIGIVVGVILTAMIVSEIMKRHTNKLWLRQEAKKYVVTDFQGRMHELENMPAQRRIKASTIHVQK
ncbi:unnamed protein product [Rotaria magnacalcarata]|uniref:RING-CH-type domain-containing protein n=2 Tax=Rotaria magnacalcarata TaxID=392030 RepID=A0A816MS64_9BILA|nr:unnamed protein product [Rotaria magnacalcarata]CAF2000916.1 unnamed protein product [Rotaria magnacalcarata]CAF2131980.1 unnamed protein product [Rotaria magnacalcarata]CAF4335235.1 unnamed protein product [Rotaria magnacalcarata]CAF4691289.1 unnamed protein product [Rotaria magnacalcarata]